MKIALGRPVYGKDGTKVGSVDRVVLDTRNDHVDAIVVHRGVLLGEDKLVERSAIARAGADGLHLSLEAEAVKRMPAFDAHAYVAWSPDWPDAAGVAVPGWSPGGILYETPPFPSGGYAWSGGLFELAPRRKAEVGPQRAIPEEDVVLGGRAAVDSSEGHRLGRLREVDIDDGGAVTGIVARVGLVHHHDAAIPAAQIAEVDDGHIRLTVPTTEPDAGSTAPARPETGGI